MKYVYDVVVKTFTFAISSLDEFLALKLRIVGYVMVASSRILLVNCL